MKSDQYDEKGARKAKRDRYWSVMLVGDHGRIIPFRQFKGLAIGGICLLVISIAALIVLSVLFGQQKQKIGQLKAELEAARLQASQFKDEKDLYLTRMIVKQEQKSGLSKINPASKETKAEAKPKEPSAKAGQGIKQSPPKPKSAPVKWAADIRKFKVTYQPDRKVLKAEFRINNTTKPKKPLAGRTVVVFKNLDDNPIHWFSVPRVQLANGEPSGSRGQSFKINNYRTMQFRAYGQSAPVKLNSATVFIYSGKGDLLVSKDFGFKIDYQPPAKPAKPTPQTTQPVPSGKPKGSGLADQNPATGGKPSVIPNAPQGTSTPPASQTTDNRVKAADEAVVSPKPATPVTDSNPPATGKTGDGTNPPSSSASPAPTVDAPATDSKPNTQGEQQ